MTRSATVQKNNDANKSDLYMGFVASFIISDTSRCVSVTPSHMSYIR